MRVSLPACLLLAATLCGCATRDATKSSVANDTPRCIQETGSQIKRTDSQCNGEPGKSLSQEDIRRTGETDTGRALRDLDPSIH